METLIVWLPATPHPALEDRLGSEVARAIHEAFFDDTLALARRWRETRVAADFNRQVVVATPERRDSLAVRVDHPGVRLEVTDDTSTVGQLFSREYGRGARAVAMVGVTTPSLPVFLLHHAFRALQFHRVVVGPSFNDGTWLVGAQRPAPDVIDALAPGHATALLRAEPALRAADVALGLLPYWFTTDDDLNRLRWHLRQPSTSGVEVIATKTLEVLERDTLTATASGS
jgi:glycosyltransferase A (GT-A) superfamily protein (DUF2064 family)